MRTEVWVVIFFLIFGALFFPFHYRITHIASGIRSNNEMERNLFSACQDAVNTMDAGRDAVFSSRGDREEAVEAFYDTLASSMDFGYTADVTDLANGGQGHKAREQVKYYVPCLLMVDWDGYYIAYTKTFLGSDGAIRQADVVTERYSFSQEKGLVTGNALKAGSNQIHVTYRLDDKVRIDVAASGSGKAKVYEGNYIEVFKALTNDFGGTDALAHEWFSYDGSNDAIPGVSGLNTASAVMSAISNDTIKRQATYFKRRKNAIIAAALEYQIGYYINLHNEYYNSKNADYIFTMPQLSEKELHKMVDAPCVAAFMQGRQENGGDSQTQYINVYSICGAELQELKCYWCAPVVQGGKIIYAREDDKSTDADESNQTKTYGPGDTLPNSRTIVIGGARYHLVTEYHLIKMCTGRNAWESFKASAGSSKVAWYVKNMEFYGTAKECAMQGGNPCTLCTD